MRIDLKTRVLAAVVLVAMVPLLVASSQGYHCARQAIFDLARNHLNSVVRSKAEDITHWLQERRSLLQSLGQDPCLAAMAAGAALDSEDGRRTKAALSAFQEQNGDFDQLVLFDAQGNVLAEESRTGGPPVPGQAVASAALADHAFFEKAAGGGVHTFVGAPIENSAGDTIGSLLGTLELNRALPELLMRDLAADTARVYLLTADGELLLSAPAPAPGEAVPPLKVHELLQLASAPEPHPMGGMTHTDTLPLAAAALLPIGSLVVAAEMEPGAALAWLDILLRRAIVTGMVTLVIVALVAMWMARLLGSPLKKLATVANLVRAGQRDARFAPSTVTEVEEVGEAFNDMLEDLRVKEQQLVQTEKLAAVGELTSRVVHEMRNPLSSIKMNVQALRRGTAEDAFSREVSDIAVEQVTRLETMLNELLQYGRPIALRVELTTFAALARQALNSVERFTKEKAVRVELVDNTEDLPFEMDLEQGRRALTNVVENAIHATPPNSTVRVEADCRNEHLEIRVLDEGPGLTEEMRKHLFKPFFTTRAGGVGLGLANVKKIVELHGGTLSAENRVCGGAVFTLRFPLHGCADIQVRVSDT
ncbi:MAG: sensor histidine kinase [Candidatus Hydrogenedentes bacterium]|nr:sensor histidine kinase [Candidatus Hydrogenedentota bacterium]